MTKINNDLLLARGFKNEKELNNFLKNCNDENWVKELKDYYGLTSEDDVVEEENKDDDTIESGEIQTDEENKDDVVEEENKNSEKKSKNKVKEEV